MTHRYLRHDGIAKVRKILKEHIREEQRLGNTARISGTIQELSGRT
jgi:hypothetical protein